MLVPIRAANVPMLMDQAAAVRKDVEVEEELVVYIL